MTDDPEIASFAREIKLELRVAELEQQLAQLQATLATVTAERDEYKEMADWFGNLVRRANIGTKAIPSLRAYIEQLESQLAALTLIWTREARIQELEQTAQRIALLGASVSDTGGWEAAKRFESLYDAAVQELKRLQLTWTKEKPTVAGWYWWRFDKTSQKAIMQIGICNDGSLMEFGDNGPMLAAVNFNGQWSGPIPLPKEAQQARGSSGGAANHGAGA